MSPQRLDTLNSIGLLTLRLSAGITMIFAHGLPKLMDFSAKSASFPDPLGLGSTTSMTLAILGELGCSLAILAGVRVREAAFGLLSTLSIIFFVFHRDHPWDYKELSLVYGFIALTLILTGGGKYVLEPILVKNFLSRKSLSQEAI